MSKIIRQTTEAPTVFIGERRLDVTAEAHAERRLGELFPSVQFITDPSGARLIPIQEVYRFEKALNSAEQAARQEGYAAGQRDGLAKGLDEAKRVLGQLNGAITDAITQREVILEEAKQKILELVIQISRKVTCDAIQIDREATAQMVAKIVDGLMDRSQLRIKVHPDFLPIVEQNMHRFLNGSSLIKEILFEPDPRVRLGGCFIQTPTGDIDARLESQFEVISETVLAAEEHS